MSSLKKPIVFTANRLLDGEVVWLGAHANWVESVELARVSRTESERDTAANEAAKADADNVVIEPYEIDVAFEDGRIVPGKFREQIRAAGPTIRTDLGKQAVHTKQAA